jgi:membrane protein DedA with SNARE-associated domain
VVPLEALALFPTALLHEDVAIVAAVYLVSTQKVPLPLAAAFLYAGVLVNNCAVYGLGATARRVPRWQRWLTGEKIERVRAHLGKGLLPALVLCRFIPGLLTPTLAVCGWLGVPLSRFLPAAAIAAAVYMTLLLGVLIAIGKVALS